MNVKKAVIPAAGLGTRFLPFTKSCPKEMLPIIDTPTLDYIVREAVECGIEDILIITGRNKGSIEDYFDHNFELENKLSSSSKNKELELVNEITNLANIHIIRQHQALGLGHAVNCAKTFVGNEPFLLMLGDEIIDGVNLSKDLIDSYNKTNSTSIALMEVPDKDVNKYGIVTIENEKIVDMTEKPNIEDAKSNLAIIGRYVITPKIFEILPNIKAGKGNEIQLTDALLELINHEDIYGVKVLGTRYDVGSKIGYLKATFDFALKNPEYKDELIEYIKKKLK